MSIIWMLLLGVAVGALAKVFWPRGAPDGAVPAVLVGVAGSLVAGLVFRGIGLANVAQGLLVTVGSALGAILFVYGYGAVRSRFKHGRAGA